MSLKVLCYGEVVMDLIPKTDGSIACKVGGAPLNVAVGLRRLGVDSVFVFNVGDDWFGKTAVKYLKSNGVKHYVEIRPVVATRTAILSHDDHKERSFEFSPGVAAENFLPIEKLKDAIRLNPDVLYFGSFPFAKGNSLDAFRKYVRHLEHHGVTTMFDPNLRLDIFSSHAQARRICRQLAALSNITRLNVEELFFLTKPPGNPGDRRERIERAAAALVRLGPQAVFVTDGDTGSYLYSNSTMAFCPSFRVKAVDTTGCGDAFTAAIIASPFRRRRDVSYSAINALRWANAAGALAATKLGGADSMPTRVGVEKIFKLKPTGGDYTKERFSIYDKEKAESIHLQTKIKREDSLYATS